MMVDDILDLCNNVKYVERVTTGNVTGGNLELLQQLPKYSVLTQLEETLEKENKLDFETIFYEPVGVYLFRAFLVGEQNVDKIIFVKDVETFNKLSDPSARLNVANKIFHRFCEAETIDHIQGISVFDENDDEQPWSIGQRKKSIYINNDKINNSNDNNENNTNDNDDIKKDPEEEQKEKENNNFGPLSLLTEGTNTIGVYGKPISQLKNKIDDKLVSDNKLFNIILNDVLNDLRLDSFPRFKKSIYFKTYIRCKSIENRKITINDFRALRALGHGAFGLVHAVDKIDCGKLYAMKQINKKRVQATNSLNTVMDERDFLAIMKSKFVTSLKYAFTDQSTIYIIMDLMLGGDLKYHLNASRVFSEDRARFHAAEILLGLEHIHKNGLVYRDLKLENVLVDEYGHCKISDFGLTLKLPSASNNYNRDRVKHKGSNGKVKGYAGTPGYIAPEVVIGAYYNHIVDFFSLGVLIFRCLCGQKPFSKKHTNKKTKNQNKSKHLDRNIIEMEPYFNSRYFSAKSRSFLKGLMCKNSINRLGSDNILSIKQHPWFDKVDFGLLEAGYLKPTFDPPNLQDLYSDLKTGKTGPRRDDDYANIEITPEFENSMKDFDFISIDTLQEELVELLKINDAKRAKNKSIDIKNDNIDTISPQKQSGCVKCELM